MWTNWFVPTHTNPHHAHSSQPEVDLPLLADQDNYSNLAKSARLDI
jgi:hypothetical protein